jgi:hypothetical protein
MNVFFIQTYLKYLLFAKLFYLLYFVISENKLTKLDFLILKFICEKYTDI